MSQIETPARKAQRRRAWAIFQLRGLHARTFILTGWRRRIGMWVIDQELARLGAETEAARRERRYGLDALPEPDFAEIPF